MGEESSKSKSSFTKDTIISEDLSEEAAFLADRLLSRVQLHGDKFPAGYESFSELTRGCLKVHSIHPGKVSCILSVKSAISVKYLGSDFHFCSISVSFLLVGWACPHSNMTKCATSEYLW